VNPQRVQKQNFYFIESDFTGRADFIAVRCTVTNKSLPSIGQFLFQGKVVKVNGM
jgi:hypothetical protein